MTTFTLFLLFGCFTVTILNTNALSILNIAPAEYAYTANEEQSNGVKIEQNANALGNSLLHSYESIVKFEVRTEALEKKPNCEESSAFNLNRVAWKVKVCQVSFAKPQADGKKGDEEIYASVELVTVLSGDTETWSCSALAHVKLLPAKEGVEIKKGDIEKYVYSKSSQSNALKKFVEWEEFNKNYVADGKATFEFEVITSSLNRSPRAEQTTAKFHLRVKQVGSLGAEYSNEVLVRGIRWKILAIKQADHLGIYVLANEDDIDTEAKWDVSARMKLLSTEKDKNVDKKFDNIVFDWTVTNYGLGKFMKWDEFTKADNGHVRNNAALFEIELIVNRKT